jgi:hypothetical protein
LAALATGGIVLAMSHPVGQGAVVLTGATLLWLLNPTPDPWRAPVYLVLVFLPVSTVLTLVLGATAGEVSRAVAWSPLWREGILFSLLTLAVVGTITARQFRLRIEDKLALALVALVVAYTALGLGSRGGEVGLLQRGFGARAWLIPLVLYFLGRLTPSGKEAFRHDYTLLRHLAWFVCATAVLEYFVLGDTFWQSLSFPEYLRQIGTPESSIFRGVIVNYYRIDSGGELQRRWVGFMGSLNLGYWLLGAMSVLAAAYVALREKRLLALLLVAGAVLLGTRTRAAIGGVAIAIAFLTMISMRKTRWIIGTAAVVLGLLVAVSIDPEIALILAERLKVPIDPSALGHAAALIFGTREVLANPLGFGVGTAGYVGSGFAEGNVQAIGESLYLSLAAELGWLGFALFAGWLSVAVIRLVRFGLSSPTRSYNWILATGVAVATIGYSAASVTTEVWRGLQAGALYWWLLGVGVTLVQTEQQELA